MAKIGKTFNQIHGTLCLSLSLYFLALFLSVYYLAGPRQWSQIASFEDWGCEYKCLIPL